MDEQKHEDPLPKASMKVGIIYNLKSGKNTEVLDAEAEYDSIDTVYAIQQALESMNHKVILLEANDDLPEKLRSVDIDIAFNIAEGRGGRGREAQIPSILNYYNIPFTGSDETTLCVALDKALTKRFLETYGILTPKYAVITLDNIDEASSLTCPVIVKPNAEGSSKGISNVSIAQNQEELKSLLLKNLKIYGGSMLAEEYIEGREFTVGVLGNGDTARVFSPMEIAYKKATQGDYHVYSYTVKQNYKEYVEYMCPSRISSTSEEEMIAISRKIYQALACRDFSRVDFRMTKEGKIYFIEINPLPGLAPNYSDYPMLAEFCGTAYNELVNEILFAATQRFGLLER